MEIIINRQLMGVEDLLWGVGQVEQPRGGVPTMITMINAANMPFDESRSLATALLNDYPAVLIVSNNIADVNSVATNMAKVTSISDNMAAITTVSTDLNDVGSHIIAVSSNIGDINTVAANIANILNVNGNEFNINTVAAVAANVTTVADNINKVNSVAANLNYVQVVYDNITEVSDTGANIASVITCAARIDDGTLDAAITNVTAFNGIYYGPLASDPSTDPYGDPMDIGDLYYNTTTNNMMSYDGANWQTAYGLSIASDAITFTNKTLDDISNYIGANHIHYPIRNESGANIPEGTVVTGSSTQPGTDYIQVVPVTDPQTQVALGVTHSTLLNNGVGLAINTGVCAGKVDTSAWDEGTILYPSNTGGFTDIQPISGRYQACAVVTRSHANQGTLIVEFSEPEFYASTTQYGYTMLVDNLTTDDNTKALTASQGKALKDSLGTAAYVDAQTSNTDNTAGRALLTGAHGLGSSGIPIVSDWNEATFSGFYYAIQGLLNSPTSSAVNWNMVVITGTNSNNIIQMAWARFEEPVMYTRQRSAGVWGSWYRNVNQGNFGIGANTLATCTNANTETETGIKRITTSTANSPFSYGTLESYAYDSNNMTQIAIATTVNSLVAIRRKTTGVWQSWYFLQPSLADQLVVEFGSNLTGNRNCLIDFHSDDTNTDYSSRIIRYGGVNAAMVIQNAGTSTMSLNSAGGVYANSVRLDASWVLKWSGSTTTEFDFSSYGNGLYSINIQNGANVISVEFHWRGIDQTIITGRGSYNEVLTFVKSYGGVLTQEYNHETRAKTLVASMAMIAVYKWE